MAKKNKKKNNTRPSALRDAHAITRDNQLNSPLLRLPGEIRNRIYQYTFSDDEFVAEYPLPSYNQSRKNNAVVHVLATCQQIRHEAFAIFWKVCYINSYNIESIDGMKQSMGLSSRHVETLIVSEDAAVDWYLINRRSPNRSFTLEEFVSLRKLLVYTPYGIHEKEKMIRMMGTICPRDVDIQYMEYKG